MGQFIRSTVLQAKKKKWSHVCFFFSLLFLSHYVFALNEINLSLPLHEGKAIPADNAKYTVWVVNANIAEYNVIDAKHIKI